MYNNGRMYGNSSNGYSYSPSNNIVSNPTFGGNTSFANACGSRQGGYYYSAADLCCNRPTTKGRYLGNGQYVKD